MRIVLDTNLWLVSISKKSPHHWLYKAFEKGIYDLALTTEILAEYEEVLLEHWNKTVADDTPRAMIELPTVVFTTVYYRLTLLYPDVDDNKFVDCAFASNANYIVTEDRDYRSLRGISFPKIEVVDATQFKQILLNANLIEL